MKKGASDSRLVYSTDAGSICPECEKPQTACICVERRKLSPQGDGRVRVRRENKGRGGKTVTTVSGLPLNQLELAGLLGELKRRCGAGGSAKDGVIEIQGDHVEGLIDELASRGFSAKKGGG